MWTPFEIWSVSPGDSPAKVLAIKLVIFSGKNLNCSSAKMEECQQLLTVQSQLLECDD